MVKQASTLMEERKSQGLCVWCARPLIEEELLRGVATCAHCRNNRRRQKGTKKSILDVLRDQCSQCKRPYGEDDRMEGTICRRCRVRNFSLNHRVPVHLARKFIEQRECDLCGAGELKLTIYKGREVGMLCRPCRWQVNQFNKGELEGIPPAMLLKVVQSSWLVKEESNE